MHRRFNPTAAVALAAVALAVAAAALTLRLVRPGLVRGAATAQVDRLLDAGRADLAMRHLRQYVDAHPDDLAMRRLQARLVAEQALEIEPARAIDALRAAIALNSRLLALEPEGSTRDDVRARLAELYIRYSDAYYAGLARRGAQRMAVPELRYQTALELADQLVEHRPDDPDARLLHAMAQEGLAVPGIGRRCAGRSPTTSASCSSPATTKATTTATSSSSPPNGWRGSTATPIGATTRPRRPGSSTASSPPGPRTSRPASSATASTARAGPPPTRPAPPRSCGRPWSCSPATPRPAWPPPSSPCGAATRPPPATTSTRWPPPPPATTATPRPRTSGSS